MRHPLHDTINLALSEATASVCKDGKYYPTIAGRILCGGRGNIRRATEREATDYAKKIQLRSVRFLIGAGQTFAGIVGEAMY